MGRVDRTLQQVQDALPAALDKVKIRYGYQLPAGVEPELECKSVALTIEPWFLLNNV